MNIIIKLSLLHLAISFLTYIPIYVMIEQINFYHMVIMYYGVATIAYIVHRTSHDIRKPEFWFDAHVLGHHYKNYPPSRFHTDEYLFKTNNMMEEADTYVYTIPIIIFLITYCKYILGLSFFEFVFVASLIILHFYAEVYIHEQVHLKKSWLDKYELYRTIKRLHLIHHKTLHKNYLFTNFLVDHIFGTFEDKKILLTN